MPYLPALDGIRAIAVLLVVSFHYGHLDFGWMGVQFFFVLSGFLITQNLLAARALPLRRYLGWFYWNRALRILPLYFLALFVVFLAYHATGIPRVFPEHAPYLLTFTYNFFRVQAVHYSPWFVHFWSLSVEEQFYLVWPFAIYFMTGDQFRRLLLILVCGLPVIRLVLGETFRLLGGATPESLGLMGALFYNLTVFQAEAFAWGAALAVVPHASLGHPRRLFVVAATLFLGCGALNFFASCLGAGCLPQWSLGYSLPEAASLHRQYVWVYPVVNFLGAALVLNACSGTVPLSRFLSVKPLVWIGKVSYGVYILHVLIIQLIWAIIPFDPWSPFGLALFLPYLALVLLVAAGCYYGFESAFLRFKHRPAGGRGSS